MDLRSRLALMPPGSLVPAEWVLAELEREQGGEAVSAAADTHGDLTVDQVAERVKRSANTVRDWCRDGRLRSYKLNGRDYRITPAALTEFLEAQRNGNQSPRPTRGKKADLGAWRNRRPAA